ncbi:MAG: CPBP family intramembrane metalloprotease [Alphaproteobacteria bacterium]|nr:CPBP family intramembrane metalloprotease [Alphaproteobacteria bacterium]
MRQFILRRPVMVFMVATMILTYPIGIAALIGLQPVQDAMPGWVRDDLVTGSASRFAPTIVALSMMAAAFGGASFRAWFRQLIRINVDFRYYIGVLVALIFGWAFATYAVLNSQGLDAADLLARDLHQQGVTLLDRVADYLGEVIYITLTNGEETGWRFFLTTILLVTFRPISTALLVWILWSVWHLPIIVLGGGELELLAAFIALLLPVSILATWLYIKTESLFLLLIAHGVFNATTEYAFERQLPEIGQIVANHEALATWYFFAPLALIAAIVVTVDHRLFLRKYAEESLVGWARLRHTVDRPHARRDVGA